MQATQRLSSSQDLSKPRLWVRPLRALVSFVFSAGLMDGLQYVDDVDTTMIQPDQTKDIKSERVHSEWCATNFSPYTECDCEDQNG